MAPRCVAVASRPAAKPAKAVPGVSATEPTFLDSVRLAAQYKGPSYPLSVPSANLNHTMKRTVAGAMQSAVSQLAQWSSGENPLTKATPELEGAVFAINHRAELSGWQGSYLFMFAVQFLHRAAPPPLDEYCAKKASSTSGAGTTPWRDEQEKLRLYDPVARTYCAMYALTGAQRAARTAPHARLRTRAARSQAVCSAAPRRSGVQAPRGRVTPRARARPLGLGAFTRVGL